jgi:hypothetical protein
MNASKPKSSPQKLNPLEEEHMMMLNLQMLQMQRTVWMMAQVAGGEVTIDEEKMDPLWEIRYSRPENSKTKLTIFAKKLPEPQEEQLTKLADILTAGQMDLRESLLAVGLSGYPGSYIIARLSPYIVLHEGVWMKKADFDALQKN